jgi:DNA-directed RNA polymerase sigma subunit (sigma70/sigma32)
MPYLMMAFQLRSNFSWRVAMNKNSAKLAKQRTVSQTKIRTSSTYSGCTLSEVADMLGVGKETVRQIEAKALAKLRQKLQDKGIKSCDLL